MIVFIIFNVASKIFNKTNPHKKIILIVTAKNVNKLMVFILPCNALKLVSWIL